MQGLPSFGVLTKMCLSAVCPNPAYSLCNTNGTTCANLLNDVRYGPITSQKNGFGSRNKGNFVTESGVLCRSSFEDGQHTGPNSEVQGLQVTNAQVSRVQNNSTHYKTREAQCFTCIIQRHCNYVVPGQIVRSLRYVIVISLHSKVT